MNKDEKNIIYREDIKSVDSRTGEVTNTTSRKLSKVKRTPDFIMLFTKHVAFLEHLAKGETAVLSEILSKYVGIENLLNMSPAIRATITRKLDVDKSYVNKAISGLVKKNIIIKNEDGLSYLNPHLFGKGNWEDVNRLRHEIAYDFDFEKLEVKETRKISTIYDQDFDMDKHEVVDTIEYNDEKGVSTQEIIVQEKEHKNQSRISFEEPKQEIKSDELAIIEAQNKTKELAIEEMKLKLEMKKEGLL